MTIGVSDSARPTSPLPQAAPAAPPPAPPRDAIVFIPGLGAGGGGPEQTVDGVALRIAAALDRDAATAAATFRLEVREQPYGTGGGYKTRVCTIFRNDAAGEFPVADVYGASYGATLTAAFERRNLLLRSLLVLLQVLASSWTAARAWRRRAGLTRKQMLQFLIAGALLSLLCVYMLLLILAAADVLIHGAGAGPAGATPASTQPASRPVASTAASPPALASDAGAWTRLRTRLRSALILLAALGVVLPKNWKEAFGAAATAYVCALYYIRIGDRKAELIGQVEALLGNIAEGREPHPRTHLLTYSFGSLLALDMLYPVGTEPPRVLGAIDTLVTIGCPFDLIRTFWPDYFTGRAELAGGRRVPGRWVNVYSPLDVLGSNFRDDELDGPPAQGVALVGGGTPLAVRAPTHNTLYAGGIMPKNLNFFDYLALVGLRAHAAYWTRGEQAAEDCFTPVVRQLYEGTPALA